MCKKDPNIFHYATSELSQDAFICWLLTWAKHENKNLDIKLHNAGKVFLNQLLDKHGQPEFKDLKNICIKRQYKNIDILVVLNNETVLLIEDKVNSQEHSGQLKRYVETLEGQYDRDNIFPIFFKTGDQSSYYNAEKKGYKVFLRKEFLEVLSYGQEVIGVKNDIYNDYYTFLKEIDEKVSSFQSSSIENWVWEAWRGFYSYLQQEFEGNWSYVPNKSGGFMGFWWGVHQDEQSDQYLQLENNKLCFKISVREKDKIRNLRNNWYHRIIQSSQESSLNIIKPSRFGHGSVMTVAMLEGDYRSTNDKGAIDLDETLTTLRLAEEILEHAIMERQEKKAV